MMATTYTVIKTNIAGDSADVILELEIPLGMNSAGVEWRRVVLELYNIRSDPGEFIPSLNHRRYQDSNYTTSMVDGEKVELLLAVALTPSDTNAQKKAAIETAVAARAALFVTEFAAEYKFYGLTGSV